MGGCVATAKGPVADAKLKAIAAKLDRDQKDKAVVENRVIKLLLLGPGGSGKSTIFKQMALIYGSGFSAKEKADFVIMIGEYMINVMKAICNKLPEFHDPAVETVRKSFTEIKASDDIKLTPEVTSQIKLIWRTDESKKAMESVLKGAGYESAIVFFDKIDEISKPGYVPTEQDILLCRTKTLGIIQAKFKIEGKQFLVVDVGGQRNERRKWIHCFEDVTAVVFVCSLAEYDQHLEEDESVPRILETFELLSETFNSEYLRNSTKLLFLNKQDLFSEKIKSHIPITCRFPEYSGDLEDVDASLDYIRKQFMERVSSVRGVTIHVTSATDATNIKKVMDACVNHVISKAFAKAGLL
jgi:GTPase SAR1 family protein